MFILGWYAFLRYIKSFFVFSNYNFCLLYRKIQPLSLLMDIKFDRILYSPSIEDLLIRLIYNLEWRLSRNNWLFRFWKLNLRNYRFALRLLSCSFTIGISNLFYILDFSRWVWLLKWNWYNLILDSCPLVFPILSFNYTSNFLIKNA